jgi:hypothetical protein
MGREKRECVGGGVVRDTTKGGEERKHYFLFEGSQLMPASPSDKSEAWVQCEFNFFF